MSPVESNPKERIYEVHSGVDLVKNLVVKYVRHTLRASSEEAEASLVEWNRGYTSSLMLRRSFFVLYNNPVEC